MFIVIDAFQTKVPNRVDNKIETFTIQMYLGGGGGGIPAVSLTCLVLSPVPWGSPISLVTCLEKVDSNLCKRQHQTRSGNLHIQRFSMVIMYKTVCMCVCVCVCTLHTRLCVCMWCVCVQGLCVSGLSRKKYQSDLGIKTEEWAVIVSLWQ